MSEHNRTHEWEAEVLASHKAYEELTPHERSFIRDQMGSADAYRRLRESIMRTRWEISEEKSRMEVRGSTQAKLRQAMLERRRQQPSPLMQRVQELLLLPVPAYQVVLAAVIIIIAILTIDRQPLQTPPAQEVVILQPQDTPIVLYDKEELIQSIVDSLKRELASQPDNDTAKRVLYKKPRKTLADASITREEEYSQKSTLSAVLWQDTLQDVATWQPSEFFKRGRSMAEDSALASFIVTAVKESL